MDVGAVVGDYEIIGVLGAGGMGKVYKVRHAISQRVEAMKVLLPDLDSEPELLDRFLREIRVQASLDHPNIAGLHTAQRAGNQLLMIMEYVEGTTLDALLKRGPLALDDCLRYTRQALNALGYAHRAGVVHRDIKPANIMLTADGSIKLMDFGIARMAADRKLTQTGRTVGSLYYMSPEQIRGDADVDGRADLYSLGVTLYEMVTGRRPFQGDSDFSIMAAHLQQQPVPPLQIDPKLPSGLNELILTAIAKERDRRFQTAEAFAAALDSVRARPAAAAPAAAGRGEASGADAAVRPSAAPRRRGLYMALGSVVTVLVLVLAASQLNLLRRAGGKPAVQAQRQEQVPAPPSAAPEPAPAKVTPAVPPPAVEGAKAPEPVPQESRPPARAPQSPSAPQPEPEVKPAAQPPPTQAAAQAPPAQPVASQPSNAAELTELRDKLMLLGTRAGAVKGVMENIQRQQAAQGLGMRADALAAYKRMEYLLDESESALKKGDAEGARQKLDLASRALEKLESLFGVR